MHRALNTQMPELDVSVWLRFVLKSAEFML